MSDPATCDICGKPIQSGSGYRVKIEVYADPKLPPMSSEQIAAADLHGTLADLMQQIKALSAEELQDGVHRSFEFQICPRCQKSYLANPLGLPRIAHVSRN
jgi:hypothetical protein